MREGRRAVQNQHAREGPQRVQALARQRDAAHEPQQCPSAQEAEGRAHTHLEQELARDLHGSTAAEGTGGQQAHQQGDADRVVRPGLALQDRAEERPAISRWPRTENTTAGSVGAMAVPSRSAMYQLKPNPKWATAATAACRQERPGDPDHDDRSGRGPEPAPADVHAAVEQDAHQCHRDDAFDRALGRRLQAGQDCHGDGGRSQEQRRRGDPDPGGEPVGEHRNDGRERQKQQELGEGADVGHELPWCWGSTYHVADQTSRLTSDDRTGRSCLYCGRLTVRLCRGSSWTTSPPNMASSPRTWASHSKKTQIVSNPARISQRVGETPSNEGQEKYVVAKPPISGPTVTATAPEPTQRLRAAGSRSIWPSACLDETDDVAVRVSQ